MSQITLRLRELRRKKSLSQEELAAKLGISRQAVIAIEQGASLPSLPVIVALLHELDIPFDTLFDRGWQPFASPHSAGPSTSHTLALPQTEAMRTIPANFSETDSSFFVTAEVPGVREEDITVDLSSQHVLILAIKRLPLFSTYHTEEMVAGPHMRILALPAPIDTSQATAELERGMLMLELPKFVPDNKRRITFSKEHRGSK